MKKDVVKEGWLREQLHLELRNGVLSHDTMSRVWGMIDPEEFQRCFRSWVSTVCQPMKQEIVSIDGKTLSGSKSGKRSALHMVSA